MKHKQFRSNLFRRMIEPDEKDYTAIVKAELLFRIFDLDEKKCTCTGCADLRKKYYDFLENIIQKENEVRLKKYKE